MSESFALSSREFEAALIGQRNRNQFSNWFMDLKVLEFSVWIPAIWNQICIISILCRIKEKKRREIVFSSATATLWRLMEKSQFSIDRRCINNGTYRCRWSLQAPILIYGAWFTGPYPPVVALIFSLVADVLIVITDDTHEVTVWCCGTVITTIAVALCART